MGKGGTLVHFTSGQFSVYIMFAPKLAWNFKTNFRQSDQRFSRNIFTILRSKFDTPPHCSLMHAI